MLFAWLSLDLVLVVAFAAALPLIFLHFIRRWLKQTEPEQPAAPKPKPAGK
jgi:hypothetical protein